MNKTQLNFFSLLLAAIVFVSCGDDDEPTAPLVEFPTEFSELTVEQNKENLEDNGIELIDELTSLKNTSGIQATIAFSKHVEGSTGLENIEGGRKGSNGMRVAQVLAAFGENKLSASGVLSAFRVSEDEFTSFQDEFNSAKGIYTYNKSTDTWSYNDTGDKIVFQFPSTEEGTTNNAEYSVFDYTGVNITSNIGGEDYLGDYPTSLKAELKIDGTKKMGYSFSASYDGNGEPTAASVELEIDDYKFSYAVLNTITAIRVDYSLSKGSENLISFGAGSTGNFNTGNIEESESPEDVLNVGSAYFQIMNIKFAGEVDFDRLATAFENTETAAEEAQAWNDNYRLVVFYADSKKKIAESEFYVTTKTDIYYSCYDIYDNEGNWIDYVCDEVEESYEAIDIRIVFADDSKATLETYTDVGFEDFQDELEAFADELENN